MAIKRITPALLALALLQACSDGSDGPGGLATNPSSLTVVPTAAPEGAPGEMNMLRFRVTLTEPPASDVNVSYQTSAATAQTMSSACRP